ncbi:NUDIX hydrolase [Allotamlana fucoidanivorans]|nr:CoA pyrophosphatase [Tamlana fucoidanivorans]
MVPTFRKAFLSQQEEAIKKAKHAGVLALFYPNELQETQFVLILRKTYKGVHSAQVGFPGGKLEKQDKSLMETALRETYEEVGVPTDSVQIFKALSKVYIPPSNFYVYPFIGTSMHKPRFVKQEDEVEDIIEVDLDVFLDEKALIEKKIKTSYSAATNVPAFLLNGHVVWGATAMMLSEIKDLIKAVV